MRHINFNEGWEYRRLSKDDEWKRVTLPHDAMIFENRTAESDGGTNTGWFEGYDYEYVKKFHLSEDYRDKVIVFEFEGVYRNAEVFINGRKAAYRPYGYTNFYVETVGFLRCGEDNEICVIARNADQPNSRWYSGAGIYRPVIMHVADGGHIELNGIKIRTLSVSPAVVEVKVKTSRQGLVRAEIFRGGKSVAVNSLETDGYNSAVFEFRIDNAELWSPDNPALYTLRAEFCGDCEEEEFGIRTIAFSSKEGFTMNGERLIIRGACIHHDNGILGARCYPEAEDRKILLLKKHGYNAVRSAHNPCSKALLKACDRAGVMVVDEYCDMWYIHKTRYDYARYVSDWYERDITDMVEKDYNHPSVIMYSLGNEVAETGQKRGIELFKRMREVCKSLDGERPVTVGVNIFFNLLYALGFGVYDDKKAVKNSRKKVGSEFFNNLAGIFGDKFMKIMAKLHGCDVKTRDCYAAMDVAGYNYGILRYKRDLKKYPSRIILGSETFCSDAYYFWETAKKNPALIGDFVWAGMDYLGEVGVGSWEYKDYAPSFKHGPGWITAGSGRIDLIGNPLGEALYTQVAFELTDKPRIAVVPVSHTVGKHSPSAWKFSNAIPSWSWNGLDGRKARVEVYSRAPVVELYINGKRAGKKKFRKNCRFDFTVKYRGGEITAVNLDKDGKELARSSLSTAGEGTMLSVVPEKMTVKRGEVCFVRLEYTDASGLFKPLERGLISVRTENCELLAVGNACPFNERGYCGFETETYYGRALAIVRAKNGNFKVAASDGKLTGEAEIAVSG